jgi:hypothetical protein
MQTDEKNRVDIFEMFARTSELAKEMVNKELQMFRKFQMDVKDIKCPLEWWVKHESISSYGISCLSDSWHCWFSNRN